MLMKKHLVVGLLLLSSSAALMADDTDIYINPTVPVGAEPVVIFTLDYRSNLGATACTGTECDTLIKEGFMPAAGPYTFFDVLRGALKKVLAPLEGVQVGFMVNHDDSCKGGGNTSGPALTGCSNGAYVLSHVRSLADSANKTALATKLSALPTPGGTLNHSFQGKELYFELFRYLTGQRIYNGHLGYTDFGDTDKSTNLDQFGPAFSFDTDAETGNRYRTPLAGATCANIYVINFMFQVSNQEDDSDDAILDTKALGGMAGINLSGKNNSFDTVIEYLKDVDLADGTFGAVGNIDGIQNVVSYFFVDPTKINQTTTGYAIAGGTGTPLPLSANPDDLVEALNNVFKSILSVSTTFVAPSVPVNVFNRSQIVDEVFLALFEADENALPFWSGNLKKLKIGTNLAEQDELQDVTGTNAIDTDGRIRRDAVTFWTNSATLPPPVDDEVAGSDGRAIERGGAGQKIRGIDGGSPGTNNASADGRRVYTEDSSIPLTGLRDLNADVPTAKALWADLTRNWSPAASADNYDDADAADQLRAVNILRFARGLLDDGTTVRPWVLADPLHSRPKPVNYGGRTAGFDADNPDIRILMGSNDGFMRMFQNTASDGAQDGRENWAFIPRALLPLLDRLHRNIGGKPVHPLGLDGSPEVYSEDRNGDGSLKSGEGDRAIAIFGLRRGGKGYYALDISNPDAPVFLWKAEKTDSRFAEMAQTWGTPQSGLVKISGATTAVVVVSGGYNGDDDGDDSGDIGKDARNRATRAGTAPLAGTNDDEGNAIFIINVKTGALVWKATKGSGGFSSGSSARTHAEMHDSFADAVIAADTDGDQLLDRIYAADTGGVVWRVDLAAFVDTDNDSSTPPTRVIDEPSRWTITKVLNVGRHVAGATIADDRRFFNVPDLAQTSDDVGPFDAVLIGSGDREDPNSTHVNNRFYLFKDRATTSGTPPSTVLGEADLADLTDNCIQAVSCTASPDLSNGWRLDLATSGEKNLAPALTAGGTVFFTTFIPSASSGTCALSEGSGRVYAVSLADATAVINFDSTNDADGSTFERIDALGGGGIPVQVVPLGEGKVLIQGQETGENIISVGGRTSFRTYWHERFR